MDFSLSQSDIDDFQRDGAVCLRSVFSSDCLKTISNGVEKNMSHPSQYSECLRAPGGPGVYFNDYCNWQNIPEFRDFAFNSPAAYIAARLTGSKTAVFYHEHVLTKDPGTYAVTPWHQDQPYYPVEGFQNCSLWIPIDEVSMDSTIQFVKGSHKWDRWFHPRKFASSLNYQIEENGEGTREYENVPDVEKAVDNGEMEILRWAVKPGDCIAFHMLTLHGAPSNTSSTSRRVLSTRWLGDDAVFAKRPWTVSPPIDGGLTIGDRFVCETFPLVYDTQVRE